MWRNLAKVQSTIQTIGNVVAPALSDGEDDDEYEDDDENGGGGSYSGEEEEHDGRGEASAFTNQYVGEVTQYRSSERHGEWGRSDDSGARHNSEFGQQQQQQQHHHHNDNHNNNDSHEPRHRGFGLVGLIAKALDGAGEGPDPSDDDEDEYEDRAHAEDEDRHSGYASGWGLAARHALDEEQIQFDSASHQSEDQHEEIRLDLEPEPEPEPIASSKRIPSSPSPPAVDDDDSPATGRVTPPVATPWSAAAASAKPSMLMLDSTSEHNPMHLADPDQLPHPRPFGQIREGGSVSPFGSPASIRSTSQSNGGSAGLRSAIAGGLPTTHENEDDADTTDDSIFGGDGGEGDGSSSTRLDDVSPPHRRRADDSGTEAPSDQPPPLEPLSPALNAVPPPPLYAEPSSKPSSFLTNASTLDAALGPVSIPNPPHEAPSSTEPDAAKADNNPMLPSPVIDPAPANDKQSEEPGAASPAFPEPPLLEPPKTTDVSTLSSVALERRNSNPPVDSSSAVNSSRQQQQLERERKLKRRCRELEDRLRQAEARTQVLEDAAALNQVALANSERDAMDKLRVEFQEKEARLLAAAAEDHEQELRFLRNDAEIKVQSLRQEMAQERDVFEREREYFEQLVAEANARAEQAERQYQRERTKQESTLSQSQKQHDREVQMRAEKLAETMALLDEREDQVSKLKALVQSLQSKLNEQSEGAQLAEDEVEELHTENEELRQAVQRLDNTCKDLQKKNADLHADSNKLSELKLELRLLKEERDRERAKIQTETAAAHGNRAQVEDERDSAIAQVQDLQQQLAAVQADLEIAKSDLERALLSRNNLQVALESFQGEREAELAMMEEQRLEAEQSIKAAHAAAMDAMREANEAHLRAIQIAADASVRHSMDEIQDLESKLAAFKAENVQMRRSLDEAIYRLQATQEDVIDRTLMKNILMDWLTKTGTKERKDVLELMASVLHFTEEEKERVHIGPHAGTLEKVVHTVAAPIPPSKADVEHLAGDTVREKWVNFLLAETED